MFINFAQNLRRPPAAFAMIAHPGAQRIQFIMAKKKSNRISTLGSQATSVISVTLVLLIVGLLVAVGTAAKRATDSVMSQVAVIVKADLYATDAEKAELYALLVGAPYSTEVTHTTADQVFAQEMAYNAEELQALGENPYSDEFEVTLAPAYVHPDSVRMISDRLMLYGSVDEVVSQVDVVADLHRVAGKLSIALGIVALALLAISLVLIYNTVSIAVYARRFVIRSMQLVGATAGFIRRPFIRSGIVWGVISGMAASLLLCGGWMYLRGAYPEAAALVCGADIAWICASMLCLGMLICGLAAYFATTRYLRATLDQLYAS